MVPGKETGEMSARGGVWLKQAKRGNRGLVWISAAIIGGTVGLITYREASGNREAAARATVMQLASERAIVVRLRLSEVTQTLAALRALMLSDADTTRAEFRSFVEHLRPSHPEFQAFEWVPRVSGSDREAFEARAARDQSPGYHVRAVTPDGHAVPAPGAEEHFPILYVEPLAGNEAVLGFDLASEPVRRRAVDAAIGSGRPTLSDPLPLVQDPGSSMGFLALLSVPVRTENGDRPGAVRTQGLVAVVLRPQDLLAEFFLPHTRAAEPALTFRVTDETDAARPVVLFGPTAASGSGEAWYEDRIELGTRQWWLRAYPTEGFLASDRRVHPLLVSIGVAALCLALTALLGVWAGRARALALRERDRMLRSVCSSLNEGVIVADEKGRLVFWNAAAERMVGSGSTDRPSGEWSNLYGCFLPDGVTPYPTERLPLVRAARGEIVEEGDMLIRNPQVPEGRWLRVGGAPITDETGTHRGGVIVFRDVTEVKSAEGHILRLVNAVEQTADAVLMTDAEGRITYVNRAFGVMTGWTSAEVLGKTPRILKSGVHDEAFYRDLWGRLRQGQVHRGTIVNRRKDGATWHAEQTITPIQDASGRVTQFVSVMKDMTERRRVLEQEAELRLAAKVQQRLYPRRPPRLAGVEVGGFVLSASATCGDYYDWASLGDGCLGIVIGDVVGHGLGPALTMAATRAYLRALVPLQLPPDEVLRQLNAMLEQDLGGGQFVTMCLARVDVPRKQLLYANAGHPAGLVVGARGALKATLRSTGIPLGLMSETSYASPAAIALETGDLIVLLTDGITECRDVSGRFLEDGPILDLLRAHIADPVPVILDRIRETLTAFTTGRTMQDDATMVVCRLVGDPP